jgi:hypothetical protein
MGSGLLKNQNELLGLVYVFHVKGSSVKFKRIRHSYNLRKNLNIAHENNNKSRSTINGTLFADYSAQIW